MPQFSIAEILVTTAVMALGFGGLVWAGLLLKAQGVGGVPLVFALFCGSLGLIVGGPLWLLARSTRSK